jgi:rhamnosyltransferase
MQEKICAVVITYYPEKEVIENISKLLRQVDKAVIIDNTPEQKVEVLEVFDNNERVKIIYNKDNLGIAKALNQGCKLAIELKYKWILTMDQDSYFENDNALEKMLEEYKKNIEYKKIFSLSPIMRSKNFNEKDPKRNYKGNFLFVDTAITSGNLIKLEVFSHIGFFDESFFIDHVDHDFCFKQRDQNFKILKCLNIYLNHSLGETKESEKVLGSAVHHHSASRKYYITRNSLIIYSRYFLKYPKWSLRYTQSLIYNYLGIILYEKEKFKKIKYIFKGFIDFFLNKRGRLRGS